MRSSRVPASCWIRAGLRFPTSMLSCMARHWPPTRLSNAKGARTGLIATEGFRDVLDIADESRFDQYDIFIEKPEPLVRRALRFTVPERHDVEGNVRLALDERAVRSVATELKQRDVESVAIAFMHSYVNADHEERAGDIVREVCPDIAVTLSSEVCPEAREYERTSTAVANAYVQPMMAGYLGRLSERFVEAGYRADIHLMTSAGTLASLETARRHPVRLVESGSGRRRHPGGRHCRRARPGTCPFLRYGWYNGQDLPHRGL